MYGWKYLTGAGNSSGTTCQSYGGI